MMAHLQRHETLAGGVGARHSAEAHRSGISIQLRKDSQAELCGRLPYGICSQHGASQELQLNMVRDDSTVLLAMDSWPR